MAHRPRVPRAIDITSIAARRRLRVFIGVFGTFWTGYQRRGDRTPTRTARSKKRPIDRMHRNAPEPAQRNASNTEVWLETSGGYESGVVGRTGLEPVTSAG